MNSETDTSGNAPREALHNGAGAQLRAARETAQLDLSHIAAETRIPLRHLEAIERGDFAALPSRTYALGFSRSFASAVGLDPAEISDAVRAELSDTNTRRSVVAAGMEPGDPARLPSARLAWFGAIAALLLAIGAFAFYNSYFGAGSEPGPLPTSDPGTTAPRAPGANPSASPTPAEPTSQGEVVLTASEDGVWLRLYEAGGERLFERTLAKGESVTVPADARDPRINTGRPDALAITIGNQPVPRLSERAITFSDAPVSVDALRARTETAAATSGSTASPSATIVPTAPDSGAGAGDQSF